MKKLRKHKGSAYVLVIMVFVFVSLFSTLMVSALNQTIYQTHATSMQMQCYYLNNQAAKATVAVLLKNDNDKLYNMTHPANDRMIHTDETNSEEVGYSDIEVTKEYYNYYGDNSEWVVARITTTIKDTRVSNAGKDFTYKGTVMVLVSNPLIQLYNLNPEDFN